jgi:hypothetical protein
MFKITALEPLLKFILHLGVFNAYQISFRNLKKIVCQCYHLGAAWSEEEKREWKLDMEKIAERLASRLPDATRKKKKQK